MLEAQYILQCAGIRKTFRLDSKDNAPSSSLEILRGIDLAVEPREIVSIMGASGSGKSTLLHILGGLEPPSSGEIHWNGLPISGHSEEQLAAERLKRIGFIFQFHHLLPEFTALENVAIAAMIGGGSKKESLEKAAALLERVGLGGRLEHKPSELSGGEQQRAAVARALINLPSVILADEPSGNLDSASAAQLMELILELNRKEGQTFVIVTHNPEFASHSGRVLEMADGALRPKAPASGQN